MGLLDDAIREHLELKRRHGADPTDLAKLEREAFGPVRRGPEPLETESEPAARVESFDPVLTEPEVDPPAPEPADEDEDLAWEEPAAEGRGQETQSFSPADLAEAEGRREPPPVDAGEDVLEETPEFLQETPEHDRLWFEQRPPRDFDFDG